MVERRGLSGPGREGVRHRSGCCRRRRPELFLGHAAVAASIAVPGGTRLQPHVHIARLPFFGQIARTRGRDAAVAACP